MFFSFSLLYQNARDDLLKKEERLTTLARSFDLLVHNGLSTAFGLVVRNRSVGEGVDGARSHPTARLQEPEIFDEASPCKGSTIF